MNLLDSVQILDLGNEQASYCSKLLADMGASVIKVEPPGGDRSRQYGPFSGNQPHPEKSLFFWFHNTNKRGITLNIEAKEGRDLLLKLAEKANAVVETFPAGYLERIGLSYDELAKKNPGLILASVTGFGQTGPHKQYKSCDIIASAAGGQMYVSGDTGGEPLCTYGLQSYYVASLFAATGILMALMERNRSGKGQQLDISFQESVAATLEHVLPRYFTEKVIPYRQGALHWSRSAAILPCRDGHVFLTFNREWETLIDLLDRKGLADELKQPKWRKESYRRQHASRIRTILTNWTRTHTKAEIFKLGQLMRFPWAPVCSLQDVYSSPQLNERYFFVPIYHPEANANFLYPGVPFKASIIQCQYQRAPTIGEHNVEVYHKELGIPIKRLSELSTMNVI